jgi:mono/diheme cytochrome c family protein
MKRLVDVVQILALVAAAFTVVMLFANEPSSAPSGGSTSAEPDGAAIYASNCAGCHGASGGGAVGPALGGGAVVESLPDEADQVQVITDGRGGMPSFDGRLSEAEIQAVTSYTRNDL